MLLMNGKLGETSAVGSATRSLKSWMLRASLGLALLGGPGCFPGGAADITSSVANCDESFLDNFNLSDEEQGIILDRCRNEMAAPQDNGDDSWSTDDYNPDDTQPHHPEGGFECRSVLNDLEEFDGQWHRDGNEAVRNENSDSGSPPIATNNNFRDVYIEVIKMYVLSTLPNTTNENSHCGCRHSSRK